MGRDSEGDVMEKQAYQIEAQAATIKDLWVKNEQLEKRVEKQKGMINWLQKRVAELEQKTTPAALADLAFK